MLLCSFRTHDFVLSTQRVSTIIKTFTYHTHHTIHLLYSPILRMDACVSPRLAAERSACHRTVRWFAVFAFGFTPHGPHYLRSGILHTATYATTGTMHCCCARHTTRTPFRCRHSSSTTRYSPFYMRHLPGCCCNYVLATVHTPPCTVRFLPAHRDSTPFRLHALRSLRCVLLLLPGADSCSLRFLPAAAPLFTCFLLHHTRLAAHCTLLLPDYRFATTTCGSGFCRLLCALYLPDSYLPTTYSYRSITFPLFHTRYFCHLLLWITFTTCRFLWLIWDRCLYAIFFCTIPYLHLRLTPFPARFPRLVPVPATFCLFVYLRAVPPACCVCRTHTHASLGFPFPPAPTRHLHHRFTATHHLCTVLPLPRHRRFPFTAYHTARWISPAVLRLHACYLLFWFAFLPFSCCRSTVACCTLHCHTARAFDFAFSAGVLLFSTTAVAGFCTLLLRSGRFCAATHISATFCFSTCVLRSAMVYSAYHTAPRQHYRAPILLRFHFHTTCLLCRSLIILLPATPACLLFGWDWTGIHVVYHHYTDLLHALFLYPREFLQFGYVPPMPPHTWTASHTSLLPHLPFVCTVYLTLFYYCSVQRHTHTCSTPCHFHIYSIAVPHTHTPHRLFYHHSLHSPTYLPPKCTVLAVSSYRFVLLPHHHCLPAYHHHYTTCSTHLPFIKFCDSCLPYTHHHAPSHFTTWSTPPATTTTHTYLPPHSVSFPFYTPTSHACRVLPCHVLILPTTGSQFSFWKQKKRAHLHTHFVHTHFWEDRMGEVWSGGLILISVFSAYILSVSVFFPSCPSCSP